MDKIVKKFPFQIENTLKYDFLLDQSIDWNILYNKHK